MDVNGDDILDLFICDAFGNLSYYTGTAVGALEMNEADTVYRSSGDYMPFYLYDWDGDGLIDILVMDRVLKLLKNVGTKFNPVFATKNPPELNCFDEDGKLYSFSQSATGDHKFNAEDFNNDGLIDIMVFKKVFAEQKTEKGGIIYTQDIDICYNSGTKTVPEFKHGYSFYDKFKTPPLGSSMNAYTRAAVADLNGDGALDIVASENFTSEKRTWSLVFFEGIPESESVIDKTNVIGTSASFRYDRATQTVSFCGNSIPENMHLYTLNGKQIELPYKGNRIWQIPKNISKGQYAIVGESAKSVKMVSGLILK